MTAQELYRLLASMPADAVVSLDSDDRPRSIDVTLRLGRHQRPDVVSITRS